MVFVVADAGVVTGDHAMVSRHSLCWLVLMPLYVYCIVQCPVLHWLCVFPASNTCCAVALPSLSRVLTLDPLTSQGLLSSESREQQTVKLSVTMMYGGQAWSVIYKEGAQVTLTKSELNTMEG